VPRFLAIDWDQNQLHLVAAKVGGGKVTIEHALVTAEEKSPNPEEAEELGRLLRERLKAARIAPAPVLACVRRDRLIVKEIRYPLVPEAEEAGLVRFQAVKELTDSPDEVVLDYVPQGDRTAPEQRSLALIARRELVNAYQALCQAAGLKLAALTPRPFGLLASARKVIGTPLTPAPEPADGAVAVVALSDRWAEFCVLQGETLLLTRTLTISPHLAGEIRRNLALYAGQAGRPPVRAVYLTGAVGELRERLADLVDLPLHSFDPLAGAEAVTLPAAQRGGFAGAAGLLYARAAAAGLPINFVQPRQPRQQEDPARRRLLLAAAVVVAALGIASFVGMSVKASTLQQVSALESERGDLDMKLAFISDDSKRLNALDKWDSPVLLDELYDLAWRISDTNGLRISEITFEPIARSAKSPYAAKMVIKGTLQGNSRRPFDDLVNKFTHEGYYNCVGEATRVDNGNQFIITVQVKRRAPGEHKGILPKPPPRQERQVDEGDFFPNG
jgi:Tfp pilus assembly PilM family ATPase